MLQKSALPLILIIVGLSVIGILFTISIGEYQACPPPIGSPIYFRAIADDSANQSIKGVKVSGSIEWLCYTTDGPGFIDQYSSVPSLMTQLNGTVNVGSIMGNYSLSIQYLSLKYSVNFGPTAQEPFFVTVSLPSGHVTVVQCAVASDNNCYNETGA